MQVGDKVRLKDDPKLEWEIVNIRGTNNPGKSFVEYELKCVDEFRRDYPAFVRREMIEDDVQPQP